MIIRLLYIAYVFVFGLLVMNLLGKLTSRQLPTPAGKKGLRFFVEGVAVAILWPLALLSKNGRKTLRDSLPR